ncbi:hypothetical protein GCM10009760_63690 [Kitasatospora kazusensis]|uniref:Uncharacterized protein n=1 Tax=Kitasatospora kazusensis TaxID=407974 RepID=A0ABP4KCG7_9ACTN
MAAARPRARAEAVAVLAMRDGRCLRMVEFPRNGVMTVMIGSVRGSRAATPGVSVHPFGLPLLCAM